MKNIKLTLLGTAALLIAVGLNIRHALNDYGVRDNKLHVEVLAQSNGSGGGGTTGAGGAADEVTCYSSYNSCWFWNCDIIWVCSLEECFSAKCDEKDDIGKCYRSGATTGGSTN